MKFSKFLRSKNLLKSDAQSAVISNECERSAVCCRLCRSQSSNHPIFKSSAVSGFTLVEVVVTLMIIVVLSLLSFPLYEGRNSETSKLAEGYALLGTIISAQVAYFNEYKMFLSHNRLYRAGITKTPWGWDTYTTYDPILGINAVNNRYFTFFNAYGNSQSYVDGGHYLYHFTAIVKSKDAGTISLEYNKTQRFEPVVTGV